MMATMLLSTGMPMILAGDEMGRTQQGNNNAYCQDSPISWVNWAQADMWADQHDLTRTLLALRAAHPVLRPARFRSRREVVGDDGLGLGRTESAWFTEFGGEMSIDDWHDGGRRALGMYLSDPHEAFLVFFNAGDAVSVTLPGAPWSSGYTVAAHTGEPDEFPEDSFAPGDVVDVPAQTIVVLAAEVPSKRHAALPSVTGVQ